MKRWKRPYIMTNEKKKSIQLLIIISFVLTLLLTVFTIAFFIYMNWKESVNGYIKEMENKVSSEIVGEIDDLVQIPLNINGRVHFLIENRIIDMNDEDKRDPFFANLVKTSDEAVYSISYGTEAGEYYGARRNSLNEIEVYESKEETEGHSFYYSVKEDLTKKEFVNDAGLFDPRGREWYITAKESGGPIFAPLYKHFIKEDLVLSAAYPIYDKSGQLQGVLGSHITLGSLNSFMKEISNTNKGSAYILELGSDNLVANSLEKSNFKVMDDGSYSRVNVSEIIDKTLNKTISEYRQSGKSKVITGPRGEKLYVNFTEYEKNGLNWLIITTLPESVFMEDIHRNLKSAVILFIVFVLISILLSIKIIQKILRPVNELIKVTDQFSEGDLSKRAVITRNDEIGKLAKSFNHMADELHQYINNLETMVRQRTEEMEKTLLELAKSNEDKQLILDSTAEGIFGLDLEDKCTFINTSGLRMLGYQNQEDLIGRGLHGIIHYQHNDGTQYPLEECRIFGAVNDGKYIHDDKESFWRADGTSFPVEYYAYPQYQNDTLVGAVITFIDITQRLSVQNALIEAKELAESANVAKSQFLANMSHEIRTPMNGIVGFLQILECSQLDEKQKEYIHMIKTSTDSLLGVINDILDLSKIEAGMLKLENITFNLHSLIETVVTLFQAKAYEKGLELNMLISPLIPRYLIGDPTRLRQVLANLVSNAVKFTAKGDIYVEVTLTSDNAREAEVLFCIKDTGIGIDSTDLDKLFQPFSQIDTSSTRKYGGTGLGLVICKKLIDQMDGTISVSSEKEKGSVFQFTVKLLKAEEAENTQMPDASSLKGKNIMVIDESPMSRYIIKVYIEELGCNIIECGTTEEAFIKISEESGKNPYHVVLIDAKQEKSLINLATVLRLFQPGMKCAFIRITSMLSTSEADPLIKREYLGTIMKPYTRAGIVECITGLYDNKKSKNEYNEIKMNTGKQKEELTLTLRILLAEDNEINQRFFTSILKMHGLSCDIAADGEEAVRLCQTRDYDIIFMDCQMPVMDGFEATRRIRASMGHNKHSKIIAMTAYAMRGDKEKCLEAGMDDYISKPIDLGQMLGILKINSSEKTVSEAKEDNFFELSVKALMSESGFDRLVAEEFITEFQQHSLELLAELKNQIELNKQKDAENTVHKLKGLAGNLRVKKIAEYAAAFENELQNKADREKIIDIYNKIQLLLMELVISRKS